MDAVLFAIEQSLDLINFISCSAKALGENASLLKSLQVRIKRISLNLHVFCAGSSVSKIHEHVAGRLQEDFNLIYKQLEPIADRVSKPQRVRNFLAATNIANDLQTIDARLTALEKHLDSYGLMLNLRTAYKSQEDLLKTLHQFMLRFADVLGGMPVDPTAKPVSEISQLSLQGEEDESSSDANLDVKEGQDLQLIASLPNFRRQVTASEISRKDKKHVLETIENFQNNWSLDFNDLQFETRKGGGWKVIGRGGFSTVYKAHLQLRGEDREPRGAVVAVAVKELDIHESQLEQHEPHFLREVHTLMQFAHPCILHTYGAIWPGLESSRGDGVGTNQSSDDEFSPMIVTERMTFDLANALSDRALQSTEVRRKIAIDLATALSYLHQNGVVHRDVKPENVFLRVVDGKLVGQAKLGDFGVSRRVQTTQSMRTYSTRGGGSASGTIIYMPPEVLEDIWKCKTRRSWDVWSFGLLLCLLGGRGDAFSLDVDALNAAEVARSGRLVAAARKWAESIGDSRMKKAAIQCLEGSWQRRATMEAVLQTLTTDLKRNAAASSGPMSFEAAKTVFHKFLLENDREAGNEACYVFKREYESGNMNAVPWLLQAQLSFLAGFTWQDGSSTWKQLGALEANKCPMGNEALKCFMHLYHLKVSPAMYRKWKAASDDGNLWAVVLISQCLVHGAGVERNTTAAAEVRSRFLELVEEAKPEEYDALEWSDILCFIAYFNLRYARVKGLAEKGAQYLAESTDLGNADAAYFLSYLHYVGYGVEQDLEKADELLGIAIRRGSMMLWDTFLRILPSRVALTGDVEHIDKIDWETTRVWERLQNGDEILADEALSFMALSFAEMYKFRAFLKRQEAHIEEAQRYLETAASVMRHWRGRYQKHTMLTPSERAKFSGMLGIFRRLSKKR